MRHQNYKSSPVATTSRDGLLRFSILATKQAYRQPINKWQVALKSEKPDDYVFLSTKQKKRHQTKHLKLKHCLPLPPALRVTPNKILRLPTKPTIGVSPSNPSIKSNAVATPVSGLGGWMNNGNDDIILPTHRQRNFRPRKLSTICSELRRRTVTDPYLDIRQGGMPWRYDIETKPFKQAKPRQAFMRSEEVAKSCSFSQSKSTARHNEKVLEQSGRQHGKTIWTPLTATAGCIC